MSLDVETRADIAGDLFEAYRSGTPLGSLRGSHDLTLADGYAIQRRVTDRRQPEEGPPIGYKVGCTSPGVQEELGIDEPIFGRVPAETVRSGGPLDVDGLIDPRVEPEIAFVLGEDLDGTATPIDVLAATRMIVPVIEVVDCRIDEWDVRAPEAVADNALAGRLVVGDCPTDPTEIDLAFEGVHVLKNGTLEATGIGADVLGTPVAAVRWLAGMLADRDAHLAEGDLVSTGSVTPMVPFEPGDVIEVRFGTIGSVSIHAT
ncbi:2-keto-4-pentenoate hydratase [Halosolutus amylolyticus]|uniref:2-keto-4-pentenoate hydratase n=1 Tax=Halosolutus amylolyticus TaxID=2932267 RepID=A0ABD5PJY2_9EURY|nr:fumarylacetoacetate hydrolase family protein [Halosolutus amylolyticus]